MSQSHGPSADPPSEGSSAESNSPPVSVCAACGCLCDDIVLVLDGGRIRESRNACPIGSRWFQVESIADQNASVSSPCRIEGNASSLPDAVRRSAELLRDARAPVLLGLTQTTIETIRVAVELADAIGATIDSGASRQSARSIHAFQRQGRVTATLGEVKARADVIVFWGVDPIATHPRHAERYSIDAVGRFRPNGRADRMILVVDEAPTATSERADHFLPIAGDWELETLWVLRSILLGKSLDPDRVQALTGRSLDELAGLVERLKTAEYGAIFGEPIFGPGKTARSLAAFEAMTNFVRELNQFAHWVILPLGGPGNRPGAEAVLSWQTGFPNAVDLGQGIPQSIPGVTSAADRLARGEADLAIVVADPLPVDFPIAAIDHLKAIPSIVIAPATLTYPFEPTVRISSGNPFLTGNGSVIRCDGVPLPIRSPLEPTSPTDRECLRAMLRAYRELQPVVASSVPVQERA